MSIAYKIPFLQIQRTACFPGSDAYTTPMLHSFYTTLRNLITANAREVGLEGQSLNQFFKDVGATRTKLIRAKPKALT